VRVLGRTGRQGPVAENTERRQVDVTTAGASRRIALPISINGYELSTTRSFHFQGRGAGVGRGLGVGSNLGVGVDLGVAVGVSVAVGVEVAVGVTVAVDVAVGVGVGVAVDVAVAVGVGEPSPHNAVTVSV